MSVDTEANYDFIDAWIEHTGDEMAVTNDPMEAHYIGFNMWTEAVRKAGTTEVDAVKEPSSASRCPTSRAATRR